MDYISDQLTSKLIEVVKKKEKKSGLAIKPFQVRLNIALNPDSIKGTLTHLCSIFTSIIGEVCCIESTLTSLSIRPIHH